MHIPRTLVVRICAFVALLTAALCTDGCGGGGTTPPPTVTFQFDNLTCSKVDVSSTAKLSLGSNPTLTITVCLTCADNNQSVGSGGVVKLDGYQEFYLPSALKDQLKTPLQFNASTKCYEKKINLKTVSDPEGVLKGKEVKINVTDKTGQTVTDTTVTVEKS